MKFYLAGSFDDQQILRDVRSQLVVKGHHVTSRWLDVPENRFYTEEQRAMFAQNDLDDIDAADVFVYYHGKPSTSGGRMLELGYALAGGEKVEGLFGLWMKSLVNPPVVIGLPEPPDGSVFYRLPQLRKYPLFEDWLATLS